MAGTDPRFPTATVKAGIRFAMEMGAAVDPSDRAQFFMPVTVVYDKGVDGDGVPFDPTATITSNPTPTPIVVDCAIEYRDASDQPTPFGFITPAKVVITLLDEEFAQIDGFKYVVLRGEKYFFHHHEPAIALFDMGVHTLHCLAESQT